MNYQMITKKNYVLIVMTCFLLPTRDCQLMDTVVNTSYEAPWTSLTFIIPIAPIYNRLWSYCRLHSIYYCLNGFVSDHGNNYSKSYQYFGTSERYDYCRSGDLKIFLYISQIVLNSGNNVSLSMA